MYNVMVNDPIHEAPSQGSNPRRAKNTYYSLQNAGMSTMSQNR